MTRDGDDINFRVIRRGLVIGLITVAAVQAAGWVLYDVFRTRSAAVDVRRSQVPPAPVAPVEPLLQVSPQLEWRRFKDAQLEQLQTYGWISREQNRVRIPIERAIELLAEGDSR